MKTLNSLLPIALAYTITISCAGCSDHHAEADHAHGSNKATDDHGHSHGDGDHDHHDGAISGIVLDNGKKWVANKETTEGVNTMLNLISNFDRKNGNVNELKDTLVKEYELIFQRCTMTGAAHEQLHSYLIPLNEKLSELNATPPEKLDALNAYLISYSNYFE